MIDLTKMTSSSPHIASVYDGNLRFSLQTLRFEGEEFEDIRSFSYIFTKRKKSLLDYLDDRMSQGKLLE